VSVQPSPVRSGGKNNPLLQARVKELELEVHKLKKVTSFTSTAEVTVTVLKFKFRLVLWTERKLDR
jgi:hypothetical protein